MQELQALLWHFEKLVQDVQQASVAENAQHLLGTLSEAAEAYSHAAGYVAAIKVGAWVRGMTVR